MITEVIAKQQRVFKPPLEKIIKLIHFHFSKNYIL